MLKISRFKKLIRAAGRNPPALNANEATKRFLPTSALVWQQPQVFGCHRPTGIAQQALVL